MFTYERNMIKLNYNNLPTRTGTTEVTIVVTFDSDLVRNDKIARFLGRFMTKRYNLSEEEKQGVCSKGECEEH